MINLADSHARLLTAVLEPMVERIRSVLHGVNDVHTVAISSIRDSVAASGHRVHREDHDGHGNAGLSPREAGSRVVGINA